MYELDTISNTSLNLFLSMALMSLNISKLIDLALPMIVILIVQAVVMMLWAYFITFNITGRDYDAAVMAAGHCGVGLGQTPNAVANMSAVIEKNGPAPTAWFVLPVVTVQCFPGDNLALHQGIYAANPGDMVIGDCDGVVVVPREYEDEVFAKAKAKFEKETHIVEALKQGKTTLEIYGFDRLIEKLMA